jgi:hypothetical protein
VGREAGDVHDEILSTLPGEMEGSSQLHRADAEQLGEKEEVENDKLVHGTCNTQGESDVMHDGQVIGGTTLAPKGRKYKKAKTDRHIAGKVEILSGGKRKCADVMDIDNPEMKKKNKGTMGMGGVVLEGENISEAGLPGQLRGSQ